MATRNKKQRERCNFELAMDLIGGKWKGLIIYHLFKGPQRFNSLRQAMPEITSRMLTLQLRELEKDLLVNRNVYAESPIRVEYSLTEIGQKLSESYQNINEWANFYKELLHVAQR